jgi:uncharacterized membrane protein YeaQ/YmgE (transglycosylase-associated protein family)
MIKYLVLAVIAFFIGAIGARLGGGGGKGCLISIVLGFIGALIGQWLSALLGIGDLFYLGGLPVIWSIIGAALFVALINVFAGRRQAK